MVVQRTNNTDTFLIDTINVANKLIEPGKSNILKMFVTYNDICCDSNMLFNKSECTIQCYSFRAMQNYTVKCVSCHV